MLFLLLFAGLSTAVAYSNSMGEGFVDGQKRIIVMSEPARDNLLLRSIRNKPIQMLPNLQHTFTAHKMRDSSIQNDSLDFLRGRELRRKPTVRKDQAVENVDLKDPEIMKIMNEMGVAEADPKQVISNIQPSNPTMASPHFEKNMYNVEVLPGEYKTPYPLTLISFVSPLGESPEFSVSLDPLELIQIGKIRSKQKGNRLITSVTVELRSDIGERAQGTTGGSYAFAVQGKQGVEGDVAMIRVRLHQIIKNSTTTTTTTTTSSSSSPTDEDETFNTGVVEIPTPILTFNTQGDQNGVIFFDDSIQVGETFSHFNFTVLRDGQDQSGTISLKTNQEELLIPTPRHITPGKWAQLIVADNEALFNEANLEITLIAELFGEKITKRMTIKRKELSKKLLAEEFEGSGEVDIQEERNMTSTIPNGTQQEPNGELILPILEDKSESDEDQKTEETEELPEIIGEDVKKNESITNIEENLQNDAIIKTPAISTKTSVIQEDSAVTEKLVKKLDGHNENDRKQWNMMSVESSISAEPERIEMPVIKKFSFSVPESAKDGSIVGEINDLHKYFMTDDERFTLKASQIVVSCETAEECLDFEKEPEYKLLLLPKNGYLDEDGSLLPIEVTVELVDINEFPPQLGLSESIIRISDGELINPFAIEIDDEDGGEENLLSIEGSAADFLIISKVDKKLYEIKTTKYPLKGKYDLRLILKDRTKKFPETSQHVDVLVANTKSRAHFRRPRYSKEVKADSLKSAIRLAEPELEGIPIDSVRFVILRDNPGWVTIDDYHGHVLVSNIPDKGLRSATYLLTIGAVSRETNLVVAECQVEIRVLEGNPDFSPFSGPITIISMNREAEEEIKIPLVLENGEEASVDDVEGIDENDQLKKIEETIVKDQHLIIQRSTFEHLRTIRIELSYQKHKASTLIHLTSTPEYLERKRKEANQPLFIHPWSPEKPIITREIREEEPIGTIVIALPANNPLTGEMVPIRLNGKDAKKFRLDEENGVISVNSRLDFDSMTPKEREMEVILEAGEAGYISTATINLILLDVDDNRPQFDVQRPLDKISLPENSEPNIEVLRVRVQDKDGISQGKLVYSILGSRAENYELKEMDGHAVLVVSSIADLDREILDEYFLLLVVEDPAGNRDILPVNIELTDENDNRPVFEEKSYHIAVVEHWPPGTQIAQFIAKDDDKNQSISYSIEGQENERFSLDEETGILKIDKPLNGLARDRPYQMILIATDHGYEPLNSSVPLEIKISTPKYILDDQRNGIDFIWPEHDFVLEIPEGVEMGKVIYTARALSRLDGNQTSKNIKYSAMPLKAEDEGYFDIDEDSGEILVTGEIDFETKRWVTLLLKAESLEGKHSTDERILRVRIIDIDDNRPEFIKSDYLVFPVDSSINESQRIGKLLAYDRDETPNANFTYHLIPGCNGRLTKSLRIDPRSGELLWNGGISSSVKDLESFCAFVSPFDKIDVDQLAFDPKNASMTKFGIKFLTDHSIPQISLKFYPNNTILTIDPNLSNVKLPLISPYHLPDGVLFEKANVDYEPALFAPSMSTNWSTSVFSIDSQTGALRVSPRITDNEQGIYKIFVNAIEKKTKKPIAQYTQNVHFINDEEKLKFVFEMGPAELAYNGERLLRKLADALITEDPEKEIDIVGDKIEKYPGEKARSSICVHAAKDGRLLSRNDLLAIVSSALRKKDSPLHNLYHIFKVINVEACVSRPEARPLESAYPLSQSLMFLLCMICVIALFLWALCAYYCLVHRYRLYLHEKHRRMHGLDKKGYPSTALPPPIPPHHLPNLPPVY